MTCARTAELIEVLFGLWIRVDPRNHVKGSPYSITERRVPELIPVLGSQPAGDVSHKPGGRLPLLSAKPAVTQATLKRAATSLLLGEHNGCEQFAYGHGCDFNPGPSAPESSTLTTRLPCRKWYRKYWLLLLQPPTAYCGNAAAGPREHLHCHSGQSMQLAGNLIHANVVFLRGISVTLSQLIQLSSLLLCHTVLLVLMFRHSKAWSSSRSFFNITLSTAKQHQFCRLKLYEIKHNIGLSLNDVHTWQQ